MKIFLRFVLVLLPSAYAGQFNQVLHSAEAIHSAVRQTISLNGDWFFQTNSAPPNAWKTVTVPSCFQDHEGMGFHGVGWYRKQIAPFGIPNGKRVLLHFQAAATEAEVWWNKHRLGSHLGGWTPFRFDVTDFVKETPADQVHELNVRLDEKAGHNTQGFLPIIEPHFGGLWQDVRLLIVPDTYIDDLKMAVAGNPNTKQIDITLPLAGNTNAHPASVRINWRLRGDTTWNLVDVQNKKDTFSVPLVEPKFWSPSEPALYELKLQLPDSQYGFSGAGDEIIARTAFRHIDAFGTQLSLNDQPLSIRGLLNWGYYPPRLAPYPDEARFRGDLKMARTRGFNLMKFCLWIPPQRYLELADEMGFLIWMEYPTWHPSLRRQYWDPLHHEFAEFFAYDRNHPSIILRSLTCETGPSADLSIMQSLYNLAHQMIPGALVEDDSSWIGWNRINDFYDDHPYGNNRTWVSTLSQLNDHILGHGPKPLLLGEAMAADTWANLKLIQRRLGNERPFWAPRSLDDQACWLRRMRALDGPLNTEQLRADSLQYAMLMRKYQAETFRREVPYGGYVISVIRDFPLASMGLLDYADQPKWPEEEWQWQRDTICLLKTPGEQHCFGSGTPLKAVLLLSHFGPQALHNASLQVTLASAETQTNLFGRLEQNGVTRNSGTLAKCADLDFLLPKVNQPTRLLLRAVLHASTEEYINEWPIWVVPAISSVPKVRIHPSLGAGLARELFPDAATSSMAQPGEIWVAARFDDALVQYLENGGRVLLLPNGQPHSFPLNEHWFLRGAPFIPEHPPAEHVPREFLLELQHFDLASEVIPDLRYLDNINPILLLWDTHGQKTVKTHGLIFETGFGQGRLLVSAVHHTGPNNPAGKWLLVELLKQLSDGPPPKHSLSKSQCQYLKEKLHEEKIQLVDKTWRFKPDARAEGLEAGWASPALTEDKSWREVRVGSAWEPQDHHDLGGWVWYRLRVKVPETWQGRSIYLTFEGVDAIYELYVNGQPAGKGGDPAQHQIGFSEKKSHCINPFVHPGETCLIAVRVYDWDSTGGALRPITLSTARFAAKLEVIR